MALRGLKAWDIDAAKPPDQYETNSRLRRNGFESVMASQDPGQEYRISMESNGTPGDCAEPGIKETSKHGVIKFDKSMRSLPRLR